MEVSLTKKQPIQELSAVIQGEGSLMGVPHILIRFSGCRLRCQFNNSFCDTWYASWKPDKGRYSLQTIIDFCKTYPHIRHVFITGGGPTLHKKLLPQVVDLCKELELYVTIETEGSDYVDTKADLISLSPKFSNSAPKVGSQKPWGGLVTQKERDQHEKWRLNFTHMKSLISNQIVNNKDYQLKPVISDFNDIVELRELQKQLDIPNNKCWLMPEGITDKQLSKNRAWLFNLCIQEGYNFTDRLHVITYGDKRGV